MRMRTVDCAYMNYDPQLDMILEVRNDIRKTCPCDLYPLTPHFYIVKLGLTGLYILFLFLL